MKRRGFTLIELLVVIAIIGFIASIVLVNLQGVRGRGRMAAGKQFSSSLQHVLGAYAVGIWRFEDGSGTTALDSSGYINNGTLNGGATWRTEAECGLELGGCLEFDGVDDYVGVGVIGVLGPTQEITISAWIYPTQIVAGDWQVVFGDTWTKYLFGGISPNTKTIGFYLMKPDNVQVSSGTYELPSLNQWYHIVGTANANVGYVELYVDGVLRTSYTGSFSLKTLTGDAQIGSLAATGNTDRFNGLIDDVYIFSTSLTTAQIEQLYVQGMQKHQLVYR